MVTLGCEGIISVGAQRIGAPAIPDMAGSTGGGSTDIGSPTSRCEPQASPVSKLLRVSNFEFQQIWTDVLGTSLPDTLFSQWTPMAVVYGFDTLSEARVDAQGLLERLASAEAIAQQALSTPSVTQGCPASRATWSWDNCGKEVSKRISTRAFRRPVRPQELTEYQTLFTDTQTSAEAASRPLPGEEALATVLQSIVLSPSVAFKPELVPGGFEASERAYAVAAKLALFARASIPDDELWNLSVSGALSDDASLRAQAQRLTTAGLDRFVRHFGGQWLDYRTEPDLGPLTLALQHESFSVFSEVFSKDAPVEKLLRPGFTVVDAALAKHYGLAQTTGPGPQRVATDARGGLIDQGAFLIRTAGGSEFRRPIHRGLWTLTRLLCRVMPRLDAATLDEIQQSFGAIDRTLPLADQMKLHRESGNRCNACHGLMDPVGLALEKYDRQGLWREHDAQGRTIVNDFAFEGQQMRDPRELASVIESSPEFRICAARQLLTYALNRGPTDAEACVIKRMAFPSDGSTPSLKHMAVDALMRSFQLTEVAP